MDDELFHQAVESIYFPVPECKDEADCESIYVEPTSNAAYNVSVDYAVRTSDLKILPDPGPFNQVPHYTAEIHMPNNFPDQPQTGHADKMLIRLHPRDPSRPTLTIPLNVYISGATEQNILVRTSSNTPAELDVSRLSDLLIASLPNELEDEDWTEWDDFKYLRDRLHDRLHNIATAALVSPESGFISAVQNHLSEFHTNLQYPENTATFEVKHRNGTFHVRFEPGETS